MKKDLISIIVPVFNVEHYLCHCIDSIIRQSYTNWELILVNDGSYDNSYKICKEYEHRDERIRVISQENQGLGMARNSGLSVARGEYLTFIDSDDFVKESYLEELYHALITTQADVAIGDYYILKNGKFIFYEPKENYGIKQITKKEVFRRVVEVRFMTVWGKLFKAKLFDYIRFKTGYFEDTEIIARLYLIANKFVLITDELYCYRKRDGSIMNEELSFKKIYDSIKSNDSMLLAFVLSKLDNSQVHDRLVKSLKRYRQFLVERELTQTDLYKEIMWRLKVINEI